MESSGLSEFKLTVVPQTLPKPHFRSPTSGDPCGLPLRGDVAQYSIQVLHPHYAKISWNVQYCHITGWFNGYCGSDDWYVDWYEFRTLLGTTNFNPTRYEIEFNLYKVGV